MCFFNMKKLNSKELRNLPIESAGFFTDQVTRNGIILILENIYDTYNVGGLFRLADALAVQKMYLCGQMEVPPNPKIAKASVGTDKIVPWEYRESTVGVIEELRKKYSDLNGSEKSSGDIGDNMIKIYAVEQSAGSIPYHEVLFPSMVALVVGNETFGVSGETLKAVDEILEIPMWGINKSLNVIVSAAIVSYHAINSKQ